MALADEKKRTGPQEFLLLRGWERYVLKEVAAEYRRMREAGEELWLLADNGIRFRPPRLGISGMNVKEALSMELVGVARDLGGYERLDEVLNAARAGSPECAQGYGGNGKSGKLINGHDAEGARLHKRKEAVKLADVTLPGSSLSHAFDELVEALHYGLEPVEGAVEQAGAQGRPTVPVALRLFFEPL